MGGASSALDAAGLPRNIPFIYKESFSAGDVVFEGKYLGSCVASSLGDDVCTECIDRIKKQKLPVKMIHFVASPALFTVRPSICDHPHIPRSPYATAERPSSLLPERMLFLFTPVLLTSRCWPISRLNLPPSCWCATLSLPRDGRRLC
jgi:hypothetical protein